MLIGPTCISTALSCSACTEKGGLGTFLYRPISFVRPRLWGAVLFNIECGSWSGIPYSDGAAVTRYISRSHRAKDRKMLNEDELLDAAASALHDIGGGRQVRIDTVDFSGMTFRDQVSRRPKESCLSCSLSMYDGVPLPQLQAAEPMH